MKKIACLTIIILIVSQMTGFASGKVHAESAEIEKALTGFANMIFTQSKSEAERKEIFTENKKLIDGARSIDRHQRNFYHAQNLILMGQSYHHFQSLEIATNYCKDMLSGTVHIKNNYTRPDEVIYYHDQAVELLEENIKNRDDDKDYALLSATIGDLSLVKNMAYTISNMSVINKHAKKSLEINANNTQASIILGISKAYPARIWGGKPKNAVKELEQILEAKEFKKNEIDLTLIYNGLAFAYARLGNYSLATEYTEKALELFPTNYLTMAINLLVQNGEI